jgi:hypothetical protein
VGYGVTTLSFFSLALLLAACLYIFFFNAYVQKTKKMFPGACRWGMA